MTSFGEEAAETKPDEINIRRAARKTPKNTINSKDLIFHQASVSLKILLRPVSLRC